MDPHKRSEMKLYQVIINNTELGQVQGQSLSDALRQVSKIRLEDSDIVTVRLEPCQNV